MSKKSKILLALIIVLAVLTSAYFIIIKLVFQPTETSLPIGTKLEDLQTETQTETQVEVFVTDDDSQESVSIIAQDLQIPWEIEFLPDGEILVTERPGNLLKIQNNKTVIEIEGVEHVGEGGLLGMTLHPNFAQNNWIYLYLTTKVDDELVNRVERYKFVDDQLTEKTIILDQIPGAKYHDGGKIAFGPDGYLYIATGDATDTSNAQDFNNLAGKILRINDQGGIPDDNPFGNAVYSYGHRNPQGIVWDSEGNLWSSEHGRSGVSSGYDELNLIEKGKNYGWPDIQGDQEQTEMEVPKIHSGPDETWAPAAIAYLEGSLYFTGLRGESLYEVRIDEESAAIIETKVHFRKDFGRLRAIKVGPDGYLYISTSNTDGRGEANKNDDKLIRIDPKIL